MSLDKSTAEWYMFVRQFVSYFVGPTSGVTSKRYTSTVPGCTTAPVGTMSVMIRKISSTNYKFLHMSIKNIRVFIRGINYYHLIFYILAMCGSRGEPGVSTLTLKNHKNIGFLSNSGPEPLKNYDATVTAFNVGPSSARQRNAI